MWRPSILTYYDRQQVKTFNVICCLESCKKIKCVPCSEVRMHKAQHFYKSKHCTLNNGMDQEKKQLLQENNFVIPLSSAPVKEWENGCWAT